MLRGTLDRLKRLAGTGTFVETVIEYYSSLTYLRERKIALLSATNFLDNMSRTIIVPLLPLYAEEVGASALLIGLIFAAPDAVRIVAGPIFGALSDVTTRRQWIVLGLFLSAASVIALGLLRTPLVFVALRGIDGLGQSMKGPSAESYIGDTVSESERGSALGAYFTMGNLGTIVGPALGGVLTVVGGIAFPFVVLGLVTLLGVLALVVYLPVDRHRGDSESEDAQQLLELSLSDVRAFVTVPIVAWFIVTFVAEVGTGAFNPAFPLLLQENLAAGPGYISLVWSVFGLGLVLFLPVGGTLTDKFGRKRLFLSTKLIWGAVTFGLVLAFSPVVPFVVILVAGMSSALAGPSTMTLRYELSPDGKEGAMIGLSGSVGSAGRALGPVLAGAVTEWASVDLAMIGIGLSWLATIPLIILFIPETADRAEHGDPDGAEQGTTAAE